MWRFARLFTRLDETNKTLAKLAALREYFGEAPPADAAWGVYFLTGGKLKRLVLSRDLRAFAAGEAGVSDWLFDESYEVVGDLAETIALLLPPPVEVSDRPLHEWVENVLLPLKGADAGAQRAALAAAWGALDRLGRFVLNKLLTGSFRVGVSQGLVMRAVATVAGLDVATVAHRLMGTWQPTAAFYGRLTAQEEEGETDASRPYPFFLAHALQVDHAESAAVVTQPLGEPGDWLAEWKWDGIRAQMVRRRGQSFLWSRGEELITERFPELAPVAASLPDGTVLDGEIVGYKAGVLPFGELQKRIGRKTLGKKLLADVPVRFLTFDLLEDAGQDIRPQPLDERRDRLERVLSALPAGLPVERTAAIPAADWAAVAAVRETSREHRAEGLMLKRRDSPYGVGRPRGPWWKWKVTPLSVDAVMVYAQRGHGRRAAIYTDYTFAVWQGDTLVPFAKAYSGLTDAEVNKVDQFVRRHTLEKFGPVRHVEPRLVMELAFEDIRASSRHKSGIAVRFPRILRWRHDKTPDQADTLDGVKALLPE